jgi:hypothetical protein
VLVLCLFWVVCSAVHTTLQMPAFAEAVAMHSVCLVLHAYASVAVSCPLPPIYSPAVAAKGIACALGMVLLLVSQMECSRRPEDFYMHHLWAEMAFCCLVLRHGLFKAVVWAMCVLQQEGIRARAEYLDRASGRGEMEGESSRSAGDDGHRDLLAHAGKSE